jgi:hypothetical protein
MNLAPHSWITMMPSLTSLSRAEVYSTTCGTSGTCYSIPACALSHLKLIEGEMAFAARA